MNVPYELLAFLPRRVQVNEIKKRWKQKPNSAIINAFDDATNWIDISMGMMESETTIKIAQDCFERLDNYILPEMRRRELL